MTGSKRVLECPFCNHILEVEPPDALHTAYSSAKPIPKSYHENVVKKRYKCENQECRKMITIYWYAPFDYFNRI